MERFVAEAPIGVMVRATLENVLSAEKLDQLFERHARRQYVGADTNGQRTQTHGREDSTGSVSKRTVDEQKENRVRHE
jgi:hypothetical protein